MPSSYGDYIVSKPPQKKHRYNFVKGKCSWCGRILWLAQEGVCGACYEDPQRVEQEMQSFKNRWNK